MTKSITKITKTLIITWIMAMFIAGMALGTQEECCYGSEGSFGDICKDSLGKICGYDQKTPPQGTTHKKVPSCSIIRPYRDYCNGIYNATYTSTGCEKK
jgi:hypothetical protein